MVQLFDTSRQVEKLEHLLTKVCNEPEEAERPA
jgi:hypothetical protein